jgi:hypothetical protein
MSTINVTSYGASPSSTDNTVAIQAALDAAQPGDTVLVPQIGDFWIDATRNLGGALQGALVPHSKTTFQIDGNLKVIPSTSQFPIAIVLRNVTEVTIFGAGKIIGDRYSPLKPNPLTGSGRHGYGIAVFEGTKDYSIMGLELREHYADGLYIQGGENGAVKYNKSIDNARNAFSLITAINLKSTGNVWGGTHSESPYPQAGIDIEPDLPAQQPLLNISITGDTFVKNKGAGVYMAATPDATHGKITVAGNVMDQHYRDGSGPPIRGYGDRFGWFLYNFRSIWLGYDYPGFLHEFSI